MSACLPSQSKAKMPHRGIQAWNGCPERDRGHSVGCRGSPWPFHRLFEWDCKLRL